MSEFFLHSFNTLSHGLIGYVIPFLFVLTIVVFFHELGHFLIARSAGVKVLAFSLGFGPELIGFNDRHGTRWKISAVPLGGYVKFFGDDSEASTPSSEALVNMRSAKAVSTTRKLGRARRSSPPVRLPISFWPS
jgi:regulator of sigma E protease